MGKAFINAKAARTPRSYAWFGEPPGAIQVVRSMSLFGTMTDVVHRIDRSGVEGDWRRVGQDIGRATGDYGERKRA